MASKFNVLRPRVINGLGRAPTGLRWKSGPYGYTQAKSLVFSEIGEPEQTLKLHLHSISPSFSDSQVLLRTLAAPVNPSDINIIQGNYGVKAKFNTDLGTPEPSAVPGNEGVFEVVSVGAGSGDIKKGDWVIPASSGFGTWRTHVLAEKKDLMVVDKTNLTPSQVATVSVNPNTAYRILRSYGPDPDLKGMTPLQPGSGSFFIQNGANSGVGRAAIQFGKLWGLRSINVIRERDSPEETAALKQELLDLGATHVVLESEFTSRSWADQLASITNGGKDPVGLGLNCVGGKSAIAIARSLCQSGTVVTYGAMSKAPTPIPVGLMIFKDIRFVGFWLTRLNASDLTQRKHAIQDILDYMRNGRFQDVPYDEIKWDWETEQATLAKAVQGGLEGFRSGKGIFTFGET